MKHTLKHTYEQKKNARDQLIELTLRDCNRRFDIITEALDEEKLQKLVAVINQVDALIQNVKGKLPTLAKAIEQAKQTALQRLGAGSGEGGLKGMLKRLAGKANDKLMFVDHLKDFVTFEAALLRGFKQLPTIVDLIDKSVGDVDAATPIKNTLNPNDADAAAKSKQVTNVIQKAFSPPGGIFRDKKVPWVDDMAQFATDFLNLSKAEIQGLSKSSAQIGAMPIDATTAAAIANKDVDRTIDADGGGDVGHGAATPASDPDADATGGAGASKPSKPGQPAAGSATPGGTAAAGVSTPAKPGWDAWQTPEELKKDADAVAGELKLNPDDVKKVLQFLMKKGRLSEFHVIDDPITGKRKVI